MYDLPIPLGYYLAGAAIAVALSFLVLALVLRKPREHFWRLRVDAPWLPSVLGAGRVVSLTLLGVAVVAGFVGATDPNRNIGPLLLWVVVVVGYGLLSLAIGNVWQFAGPWSRHPTHPERRRLRAPRAIAGTAGAVLLFGLFWFELVSGWSFRPQIVGFVLVLYAGAMTVLSARARGWVPAADPLGALFRFIGRVAFVRITPDARGLVLQPPSVRLRRLAAPWWTVGIACVLLAGASFDSVKESILWFDVLRELGLDGLDPVIPGTIGLALAVGFFAATYFAAVMLSATIVGQRREWPTYARRFVWSIVPVAFAYTLSHNFPLVVVSLPVFWRLLSDPFGLGWDLFGTATSISEGLILGAQAVWFAEIGFIVIGHVAGVWLAHTLALRIFGDAARATASQLPLALLMAGYTALTLWLLSVPLVT